MKHIRQVLQYGTVVGFVPITLIGWLIPANKYSWMGPSAYVPDCDGPLKVMIFILPATIVYGCALVVVCLRSLSEERFTLSRGLTVLTSLAMLYLAVPKMVDAINEHNNPVHREQFGAGW